MKLRYQPEGGGVGEQFECGRIYCCTSDDPVNKHCIRPGCAGKGPPLYLGCKPEQVRIVDSEAEGFVRSTSRLYKRFLIENHNHWLSLGSASDVPPSLVCSEWKSGAEGLLWGQSSNLHCFLEVPVQFSGKLLGLGEATVLAGVGLSFRDQLDRHIADLLEDFGLNNLSGLFRCHLTSNLAVQVSFGKSLVVLDRRLEGRGRILKRLADSLGRHPQASPWLNYP